MREKGVLLALVCCILAVWLLIGYQSVCNVISATVSLSPTIIIDAGHGGFDGGATGVSGVIEKDLNLAISKKLEALTQLSGFETIMVRNEDTAVCDDGIDGIRNKKVSDIHNRLDLTRKHPNAIFLSIHQNIFGQQKYWGTQVFYGAKNPQSKSIAEYIQRDIAQNLQKENRRAIKKAEKNLYILYNTDSAAVMVECGFLSNPEECAKLENEEYQQQLCFEIMRALIEYNAA